MLQLLLMKQFILLLDGMTGAGKTTTTKYLAKELPRTAIFGMDKVKRFITDFERGERDNAIARNIVFEMTKKYFESGISVIIDQPFVNEGEVEQYEKLSKDFSVDLYKFQLFATPTIAYERVMNRQRDLDDKVPEDRVKRNISLFKTRENLGFTVIDTSNMSEESSAKLILKTLTI